MFDRRKDAPDGYPLGGRPGREHPQGWFPTREAGPVAPTDVIRPPDRQVASNRDD